MLVFRTLFAAILLQAMALVSLPVFGQKILLAEDYKMKVSMAGDKMMSSQIVEDEKTGQRLLIVSGGKEATFYQLDQQWKPVNKFSLPFVKNTAFAKDGFSIITFQHKNGVWDLLSHYAFDNYHEVVDFNAKTHTVKEKVLTDMEPNIVETRFSDEGNQYVMYISKTDKNAISLVRFDQNMSATNLKLPVDTKFPADKNKKYTASEIYSASTLIDTARMKSVRATRHKTHFYVLPQAFALVLADESAAELSLYDKATGRKLKSAEFSTKDAIPADKQNSKLNSSVLMHDNTLWLFTAYKGGGVVKAFDVTTQMPLYNFAYTEKSEPSVFAYPPSMYETAPNATQTKLTEKVNEVSMDKFCAEMLNHSSGLALSEFGNNQYLLKLANYDQKTVATATAGNRTGTNTATSPMLYVYTSAGLLLDRSTKAINNSKTTWKEAHGNDAGEKYEKVEVAGKYANAEFNDSRKSFVLGRHQTNAGNMVVYYTAGKLKVASLE